MFAITAPKLKSARLDSDRLDLMDFCVFILRSFSKLDLIEMQEPMSRRNDCKAALISKTNGWLPLPSSYFLLSFFGEF